MVVFAKDAKSCQDLQKSEAKSCKGLKSRAPPEHTYRLHKRLGDTLILRFINVGYSTELNPQLRMTLYPS